MQIKVSQSFEFKIHPPLGNYDINSISPSSSPFLLFPWGGIRVQLSMLATGSGGAGVWREVGVASQPIMCSYQPPLRCISSFQVLVTTPSLLGLYHLLADSPWPPVVHTVSFLPQLEGSLYLLARSDTLERSPAAVRAAEDSTELSLGLLGAAPTPPFGSLQSTGIP